jgi:hypothetical protein
MAQSPAPIPQEPKPPQPEPITELGGYYENIGSDSWRWLTDSRVSDTEIAATVQHLSSFGSSLQPLAPELANLPLSTAALMELASSCGPQAQKTCIVPEVLSQLAAQMTQSWLVFYTVGGGPSELHQKQEQALKTVFHTETLSLAYVAVQIPNWDSPASSGGASILPTLLVLQTSARAYGIADPMLDETVSRAQKGQDPLAALIMVVAQTYLAQPPGTPPDRLTHALTELASFHPTEMIRGEAGILADRLETTYHGKPTPEGRQALTAVVCGDTLGAWGSGGTTQTAEDAANRLLQYYFPALTGSEEKEALLGCVAGRYDIEASLKAATMLAESQAARNAPEEAAKTALLALDNALLLGPTQARLAQEDLPQTLAPYLNYAASTSVLAPLNTLMLWNEHNWDSRETAAPPRYPAWEESSIEAFFKKPVVGVGLSLSFAPPLQISPLIQGKATGIIHFGRPVWGLELGIGQSNTLSSEQTHALGFYEAESWLGIAFPVGDLSLTPLVGGGVLFRQIQLDQEKLMEYAPFGLTGIRASWGSKLCLEGMPLLKLVPVGEQLKLDVSFSIGTTYYFQ